MMNFVWKKMNNKKGFTLIELIVVIAILGILAAIAIPRLSGFTESARQANDKEAAALIANAAAMYVAQHQSESGFDPDAVTIDVLKGAGLLADDDDTLESEGYGSVTLAVGAAPTYTVTVTLGVSTTPNGAIEYVISK